MSHYSKKKLKDTVITYGILTLASLIMICGIYVFKFPNNYSFGGVSGIAIVLSALIPLSAGTINLVINMLLLILGFLFLGKGFSLMTTYVSVLMSVGLSLMEQVFPLNEPLTNEPEPICDYIHHQLKRSATLFEGEGTYAHRKRYIILTVMKRGQAVELRNFIRSKEPNAFITIMNSSEIIGKGFRGLN